MKNVEPADFENVVHHMVDALNTVVFPALKVALLRNPALRATLNPAFPFPTKVRIGALDTHLVVEYVGPEDPTSDTVQIEASWSPGVTVFDHLGLPVEEFAGRAHPYSLNVENLQVFLGDAIKLLGDYLYDVVSNPNDLMVNGYPDFSTSDEPSYMSNVSFLWSDKDDALRIRRFDFVELFPVQSGGWVYHADEGLPHFARFLEHYKVPSYRPQLHKSLNDFIELVSTKGTSEPAITQFLSDYPAILQLAFGMHELNPQVLLEWQYESGKDNLQPDFLPIRMDGYADIVEFKLPWLKSTPISGSGTRRHPSFEIDLALSQIDEYAEWCAQDVNRIWLHKQCGIKVHTPHTYLIIGHRSEFDAAERQKLRGRRNATILTYDEFVEMARMQLYRVR